MLIEALAAGGDEARANSLKNESEGIPGLGEL
jgi:hypothetical protein